MVGQILFQEVIHRGVTFGHTNPTLDTNTTVNTNTTTNTRVWGENSAHAYLTNYRGRRQSRGGFPHLVSNTTCRRWSVGEGMWPSRSRGTSTSSTSSTSTSSTSSASSTNTCSMSSASSRGRHVFKWHIVATLSMWVWSEKPHSWWGDWEGAGVKVNKVKGNLSKYKV